MHRAKPEGATLVGSYRTIGEGGGGRRIGQVVRRAAFFMVGTIEEAVDKAKSLAAEAAA